MVYHYVEIWHVPKNIHPQSRGAQTKKVQTISLDLKCLFTKLPVSEANEIALRYLYSSDNAPDIKQSTLKL